MVTLEQLEELTKVIDSEVIVVEYTEDCTHLYKVLNEDFNGWTLLRAPIVYEDKLIAVVIKPEE